MIRQPSVLLRREALAMGLPSNRELERKRVAMLAKSWELNRMSVLSQSSATDDLNASAYFHAQPCTCQKCNL